MNAADSSQAGATKRERLDCLVSGLAFIVLGSAMPVIRALVGDGPATVALIPPLSLGLAFCAGFGIFLYGRIKGWWKGGWFW